MADQRHGGISWTDYTWNPVTGCTKVSPGCAHCYAETVANRLWATQYPSVSGHTHDPFQRRPRRFTDVQCHPDRLDQPLHWRKPRRVFVGSMSDLFHEDVPDEFIDQVFATMLLSPQHTFQVLTKRAERMRDYSTRQDADTGEPRARWDIGAVISTPSFILTEDNPLPPWPLPNVWLGVTVEDQPTADERVWALLQTQAAVRFLSVEPLLGRVRLHEPWCMKCWRPAPDGTGGRGPCSGIDEHQAVDMVRALNWVIVGGESGPDARIMRPEWARSLRDSCQQNNVPFHFKQWGEWLPAGQTNYDGPDQLHWTRSDVDRRLGVKPAGRLLDGRLHQEMPT